MAVCCVRAPHDSTAKWATMPGYASKRGSRTPGRSPKHNTKKTKKTASTPAKNRSSDQSFGQLIQRQSVKLFTEAAWVPFSEKETHGTYLVEAGEYVHVTTVLASLLIRS